MNFKLILLLSMFGLAMAIATVYFIPSSIEPIIWLVIFIICAYIIAKKAPGKFFLHGLLLGIFNSVWVTGAHLILYNTYIAHHLDEAATMAKMSASFNPKLLMLVTGIIIGIISGLFLGLFSFIARKIVKKPSCGRYDKSRRTFL